MATSPGHIHLQRWCGACGDVFSCGEAFVSGNEVLHHPFGDFFTNPPSTVLHDADSIQVVGSYEYPCNSVDLDILNKSTNRFFTHRCFCPPLSASKCRSATVHADCFNLFRRSCADGIGLRRLVLAAIWRNPWRDAPTFKVSPEVDVLEMIRLAARACDLPKLMSMPPEIKCMIWQDAFDQPSQIARYQSVLSLAADSCDQDFDQQSSVSIRNVASWERGGRPVVEKEDASPFIRITIDNRGVKCIERLKQRPAFLHQRSDTELYIVETQETLADIMVQFQSGLACLNLGESEVELRPWDIPAPPPMESLPLIVPSIPRTTQFSTIDLARITGITFFISRKTGTVLGIHTHKKSAPSADAAFDRLSAQYQRQASWIYVPFPSDDRLTFFGVRWVDPNYWHLLLRFKKAGDYIVGLHSRKDLELEDSTWPVENQLSLVCSVSVLGSIRAISALQQQSGIAEPPFPRINRLKLPPAPSPAFLSSAPLEHVIFIRVFTDVDIGTCRGLLLEYENGSQRSLGECRIGLDLERTYRNPVCICIAQEPDDRRPDIKVRADCKPEHKHKSDDWKCHRMRGTLKFWFTYQQSGIEVTC
ncbi:hypothetical protein TARUN_4294 [Trichoderma arundinaceum]|uniref:Uncharacterized protein n=1 Tax=Trichoderma arundinaceum TaxID=490622 RepID=A0A395NPD9_TRIAR|nr:hypothetical protein TARUN_4294 [Trichoderma arundinaceum]